MAAPHTHVRRSRWAGLAALMPVALVLAQDRVGAYDFAYRLAGDARARPVQVFDDGRDTFFQFRPDEPVPAIFADGAAGPRLLPLRTEGPYVKVPAVADGFSLRLGLGAATVSYLGAPRRPGAGGPATSAPKEQAPVRRSPQPSSPPPLQLAASHPVAGLPRELLLPPRPRITLEEGSYATPLKGDAIEWTAAPERVRQIEIAFNKDSAALTPVDVKQIRSAVADARASSRFELASFGAAGQHPGLVEARERAVFGALVAAGAAPRNIAQRTSGGGSEGGVRQQAVVTLRVIDATTSAIDSVSAVARPLRAATTQAVADGAAASPPPAQLTWAVRKSDGTLERMLARWAIEAGWTLVWQDGPAVAITGDASLSRPDYLQAADYALEQARGAGWRLRATAYRNQVLVVGSEE